MGLSLKFLGSEWFEGFHDAFKIKSELWFLHICGCFKSVENVAIVIPVKLFCKNADKGLPKCCK